MYGKTHWDVLFIFISLQLIKINEKKKKKEINKFVSRRGKKITLACFFLPLKREIKNRRLIPAAYFLPLETPGLPACYTLSFINWMLSAFWNFESRSMCLFGAISSDFIQMHMLMVVLQSFTCCCFAYWHMTLGNVSLQVRFCFSSLFYFLGVQRKIIWLLKSAFVFFAKY